MWSRLFITDSRGFSKPRVTGFWKFLENSNCQIINFTTLTDMKSTNSFTQMTQLKEVIKKFLNDVIRGIIKIDVV